MRTIKISNSQCFFQIYDLILDKLETIWFYFIPWFLLLLFVGNSCGPPLTSLLLSGKHPPHCEQPTGGGDTPSPGGPHPGAFQGWAVTDLDSLVWPPPAIETPQNLTAARVPSEWTWSCPQKLGELLLTPPLGSGRRGHTRPGLRQCELGFPWWFVTVTKSSITN